MKYKSFKGIVDMITLHIAVTLGGDLSVTLIPVRDFAVLLTDFLQVLLCILLNQQLVLIY